MANEKQPTKKTRRDLESQIKILKRKLSKKSDDGCINIKISEDDCCCGCCIGLAIGTMLCGAAPSTTYNEHTAKNAVVETIQAENFLLRQIDNYQKNISPRIKERLGKDRLCKFEPSCSEYAKQAIEKYGSVRGSLKAASRLIRCNPFTEGGYDHLK